jgi:hypothetical protein
VTGRPAPGIAPSDRRGRDTRSDGGWCRIGHAVPGIVVAVRRGQDHRSRRAGVRAIRTRWDVAACRSGSPRPVGHYTMTVVLTDQQPVMASNRRNELIHRLPAKRCQICACTVGLEVHHIRKLADLNPPGRRERSVMRLMAIRHPQHPGDLPPLSRGRPCWKCHQAHPTVITGERGAGKPHAHSETGRRRGPDHEQLAGGRVHPESLANGAGTTRPPRPQARLAIQGDLVGRDSPPGTARLTARARPPNAPGRRSWRRSAARRRPRAPPGCAGGVVSR